MASDSEAREKFESAIEEYLTACYRDRTAARVSELASFLSTDRSHLTRATKCLLGVSLKATLRSRQLTRAGCLMHESTMALDEVAILSGFGDRRTFYRAFRRAFGTSPSSVRKAATNCP